MTKDMVIAAILLVNAIILVANVMTLLALNKIKP